jgi:hypothetical protein
MHLKTTGRPSKIPLPLCKKAVKFFANRLLGKRLYDSITVHLLFDKNLSKTNEYAYCDWEDKSYKGKQFTITIDPSLHKKNMLLTLAHEMVHVKQYAKGELKDYVRLNKVRFKDEIIESNKVDYWELPWEIEALGREIGLYYKFLENERKGDGVSS